MSIPQEKIVNERHRATRAALLIAWMAENPGEIPESDDFDLFLRCNACNQEKLKSMLNRHADEFLISSMSSEESWHEFQRWLAEKRGETK